MEGVSSELTVLLMFLAASVLVAVVLTLQRGLNIRAVDPGVAADMRGAHMDVPRAGEPAGEGDCPISLEPLDFPVTTPCNHTFSANSVLDYWQAVCLPGVIKCPMCRAEAKELMECFRPAEWGAAVAERRAVVLRRIVAYNHRYSDRTTAWERIQFALQGLGRAISAPRSLLVAGASLITGRLLIGVVGSIVASVVYALLPVDLIPDGLMGGLGYLDDLVVAGAALLFVAEMVRSAMQRRMGMNAVGV
ncbi:hypothetical protein FNF29_06500 [Cafeteria roenbergensis]|uniref:Uncharacterized protein n=1 Tax=Cafeteria roenbergensis TaxID=33653 RepID=A0A5A8C787_CAFRO|nr:hypothetical protein FNF29_06500 [Cafeteria roenbergensis]KAA0170481.1 hypothetical protein FNF28_01475 [Cafeteria roenbergensis]|eukprot:KAA0148718.1 hypothetical protein FNF29_06500 [Cafeteria roenbergensis]